ncbi:MAG: Flp pilus assembly complex ATPase component TadA, partial [Erythrobacter sp.]|nr:Flp pilus assembly complex ATPase component TadA [Erythrobacter sp.]
LEAFQRAIFRPYGMVLVTGPTGSGKTNTLYSAIATVNTPETNIMTAEDPVEFNLHGINQVQVKESIGLTFAASLRSFLRQDPNIVLVGEIRDFETAEIGVKAALTGHLVLSTLHTNDAPRTLTRLVDMGVKPYAIATSISLIIAQRLARRLCQDCREARDIPDEALRREGFPQDMIESGITVYAPVGCHRCSDGYKGRVGIYQVMPVTETIGRIILEGGNAMQIAEQAENESVWDLRRSGLQKVIDGVTSLEEINRVTVD